MTFIAKSAQTYQRRQIVARMGRVGEFRMDGKRYIIWKHMTLWASHDQPSIAVEFVRKADIDKDGFLRLEAIQEGEILITPGFIYKKIPMSGMIMNEHLRKMRRFKPRDITVAEVDRSDGAVDLGTIDLRTER